MKLLLGGKVEVCSFLPWLPSLCFHEIGYCVISLFIIRFLLCSVSFLSTTDSILEYIYFY